MRGEDGYDKAKKRGRACWRKTLLPSSFSNGEEDAIAVVVSHWRERCCCRWCSPMERKMLLSSFANREEDAAADAEEELMFAD